MANKTIRRDAPDTVGGVRLRVAAIRKKKPEARYDSFNALVLDTLVGIAEAGKDGCRAPDDPVEVAREVLRYGGELYQDESTWVSWEALEEAE